MAIGTFFKKVSLQYRCYRFLKDFEKRTKRDNYILIEETISLLKQITDHYRQPSETLNYTRLSAVEVSTPHVCLDELISELELCCNLISETAEMYLPTKRKSTRSLLSWFILNSEVPHEKQPPHDKLLPVLIRFKSLIDDESVTQKTERLRRDLSDVADSLHTCVKAYYLTLK